jgi:c-di-GMP-binding flagellar brake protein YcgR
MRRLQITKRVYEEFRSKEGRQHPRVFLNLPIEYSVNNPVPRPGHTFNLSPGGVMLNIPERLNTGQTISLAIFFSLGTKVDEIKVHSQVVWVDNSQNDGSYRSGVKFIDLTPADKKKLQGFFKKF